MYPYLDNESVSYVPPHLAVLFNPGIGNVMDKTGGILSINTKSSRKFRHKLPKEFKLITPLGYQKRKNSTLPHIFPKVLPRNQQAPPYNGFRLSTSRNW